MSEKPYSCDTVGPELKLAEDLAADLADCCALKRTGTLASESKVMCLFQSF